MKVVQLPKHYIDPQQKNVTDSHSDKYCLQSSKIFGQSINDTELHLDKYCIALSEKLTEFPKTTL